LFYFQYHQSIIIFSKKRKKEDETNVKP